MKRTVYVFSTKLIQIVDTYSFFCYIFLMDITGLEREII